MKVPTKSDRARSPAPGFVTVYEFSLRARLRFLPHPELIDILMTCGVSLSQFFYRAMSIIMGLIMLFRDRGAVLSPEYLSWMGHLIGDTQGRVSFRFKCLDIHTRDPSKGCISDFFFIQNDWNLQEKWRKLKELPVPLNFGAEDLLKILKLPNIDALHYEGECKKKYDGKVKEKKTMEEQLAECRTEITNMMTSASLQNQQMDRLHIELVDAQVMIHQQMKDQQILKAENKSLQSMLSEKKSFAFKILIEDQIQEARNHIYDMEVKALEADCMEEGFIRGFMKGICTVQRKTGAEIEELTPNQASSDPSSDSGSDEIESELQKIFAMEEEEEDIEILSNYFDVVCITLFFLLILYVFGIDACI
ncbi:hypothetical protein IEQ34_000017 [Dendrobium chrysotoxum]|uniref:Uncharacterized protein n=1 Tax=Dendrobium chrysotoxum TaxID=161865 RepID=A0AAV7H926_DENCH|nr:hypothetical protein IEQ34_000017 [Dendrobium chrysotoxum]